MTKAARCAVKAPGLVTPTVSPLSDLILSANGIASLIPLAFATSLCIAQLISFVEPAHHHEELLPLLVRQNDVVPCGEAELHIASDERADVWAAAAGRSDVRFQFFVRKEAFTLRDVDWRHGMSDDGNRHLDPSRSLGVCWESKPAKAKKHGEKIVASRFIRDSPFYASARF